MTGPLAAAITEAINRLKVTDSLPPRLKFKLQRARTVLRKHESLTTARKREKRVAVLEAAILAQDEELELQK